MARCHTHDDRHASGVCRRCDEEFCETCLVYSYGRAKPPYCIRCALVVAGADVIDLTEAPPVNA